MPENQPQTPVTGPVYREKPVELVVNRADQPVEPAQAAPEAHPGVPVVGYGDVDPRDPALKPAEGVDVKPLGEPASAEKLSEPAAASRKPEKK